MKINKIYIAFAIASAALFASCNSDGSFDNKAYNTSSANEQDVLVKMGTETLTKTLSASIAKPTSNDITINYTADMSKVSLYNTLYNDTAIALPSDYYEIDNPKANITAGAVQSSNVTVTFKNLSTLDMNKEYVLPVSIDNSSSISVLTSKQTTYFVVKGAALINTVANMENTYLMVQWANPSVVTNMTQITMEGLVNVRAFDKMISTFMGIEGYFLMRFGDAGFPPGQMELATSYGNYPTANSAFATPTGQWVHIAMTLDCASHTLTYYQNGQVLWQTTTNPALTSVSLGKGNDASGVDQTGPSGQRPFCIGASWDPTRYLTGDVSELRIWNVVRTQAQIATNPYYVDPSSPGLVAYWKCDEGAGTSVADATGNGNNATAMNGLKWDAVTLPAK